MTIGCSLATALAVLAATLSTGCSSTFDPSNCADIEPPAVTVRVQDAVSYRPTPAGTTATAQEGAYTTSLTDGVITSDARVFGLAVGRTGEYVVTVNAPGYQTWTRQHVVVTRQTSGCRFVQGITLTAGMVK